MLLFLFVLGMELAEELYYSGRWYHYLLLGLLIIILVLGLIYLGVKY